ncbi:MAG: bifunctional phosphoribosylaminoimidazolecarboxamide formyltransferase/IMP cyclohydrolase [Marinilabiliaceae bacterium]|nr:bifunctional phosphoribosylaminoimidazolecarboxamide formyltransferase/IMP cyclohydrolase [Marinilabiliaceae bacterium]
MSNKKQIKNALISVFYKDGLDEIVRTLDSLGVKIISTGGTQTFIEGLGIKVTPVEKLTGYPSILGGRVKTLHPNIFGGILGRRDNSVDLVQMRQYNMLDIDLVIVDLYPFEETVTSGASHDDIIEKIDIGGISLIRAAAKNYKDVVIVPSKAQYAKLQDLLYNKQGFTEEEDRLDFARDAFAVSSHYDSAIFSYFDKDNTALRVCAEEKMSLRYGENPHQKGVFYGDFDSMFEQLHGKEISYNNLLDIDSAYGLINEFEETTVAILKHNNACGLASRQTLLEAWKDALAGDPVSAFGGVVVCNKSVDLETAEEMNKIFFEVVIAPAYSEQALEVLKQKKNRIILAQKSRTLSPRTVRSCLNGILVQDRDLKTEDPSMLQDMGGRKATQAEIDDLIFANKIVKHTKSNAIVLAKNKQLFGSGTGQTSRVDSLRHAIEKAKAFNFSLKGAVMASDAFFPFGDCVEMAHKEGIEAVIEPGGSIRDNETIEYCTKNNLALVFSGIRHFKH